VLGFFDQRRVMSPPKDVTAQAGAGSKLKVFVSYARNDATFADELVSGLELCGFEAYLDKADIAPGEPWEARLGRLIRDADTVVYVLSPSSVASDHCTWEVAETVRPAATNANKEISVLTGHRVERSEVGAPGEFESLNDDELERVLIERLGALGFALSPIAEDGETQH
jgi:TIR domain